MEYLREENALALRMLSRTHAVSAGPAESRREEKKKKEKKAKVQPPAASKLRILALHGYEQDSEILRHKSGALRSHVKAVAEFEFLDAPHAVPDSPEGRAWFLFGGFEAGQSTFEGLEESFSAIDRIFETSGPFDGIFGFSQGAALAAALCIITEARRRLTAEAKATGVLSERATAFLDLTKHCDFRFALLVSGFIPSDPALIELWGDEGTGTRVPLTVPCFQCYGEGDGVVPPVKSRALCEGGLQEQDQSAAYLRRMIVCDDPLFAPETTKVMTHSGGHLVPTDSEVRKAAKEFLRGCQTPSQAPSQATAKNGKKGGGRKGQGASALGDGPARDKVLLLHGFTQNIEVFSKRSANLVRKAFGGGGPNGRFDLRFCEAPLACPECYAAGDRPLAEQKAWFVPHEQTPEIRPATSRKWVGWRESLAVLQRVVDEEGPFHTVLGFSQGGVMATLLLATRPAAFRAAVLIGTNDAGDPEAAALLDGAAEALTVPSLHFSGENDELVPTESSRKHSERFAEQGRRFEVVETGHGLPPNRSLKILKEFIEATG